MPEAVRAVCGEPALGGRRGIRIAAFFIVSAALNVLYADKRYSAAAE